MEQTAARECGTATNTTLKFIQLAREGVGVALREAGKVLLGPKS